MVPRGFEFALPLEPYPYDPVKAKQLPAEAGYPNGFDAGTLYPYSPYFSMGESVAAYFAAVGIKTRLQSMERAAFQKAWLGKTIHSRSFYRFPLRRRGVHTLVHAFAGLLRIPPGMARPSTGLQAPWFISP